MCKLCGTPEEQRERIRELDYIIRDLKNLTNNLCKLKNGTLKPHTNEVKIIELEAHSVIRRLVEEWV